MPEGRTNRMLALAALPACALRLIYAGKTDLNEAAR